MKKVMLIHASQIATPTGSEAKHGKDMCRITIINDGAVYIEDGIIKEVGETKEVLKNRNVTEGADGYLWIDASGHAVIPGFVDSHTHFVFGGYRLEEFFQRLSGAPYLEILGKGGGIQSTVKETQKAEADELYELGIKRLNDMLSMGVTTVEGKSGYGLDGKCEIKQLEVMKKLNDNSPVDITVTYLGAHAVPPEYRGRGSEYISNIIDVILPEIAAEKKAEFVDIFCEDGVFTIEESERLLKAAKSMGFGVKIHADEIVSLGGGELAAELSAVSADHLLMVSDKGIQALAESNTVATLLPCTAFCLNKPYAPARKLIDSGCAVALASDYNPGSCFTNSIPLLFSLAVITMGMKAEEALCGLTLNGAAAIARADSIGTLEAGKKADLLLLDYPDYRYLVYNTGKNIVDTVIKNGTIVYKKI